MKFSIPSVQCCPASPVANADTKNPDRLFSGPGPYNLLLKHFTRAENQAGPACKPTPEPGVYCLYGIGNLSSKCLYRHYRKVPETRSGQYDEIRIFGKCPIRRRHHNRLQV
jgi:hypothetical protein